MELVVGGGIGVTAFVDCGGWQCEAEGAVGMEDSAAPADSADADSSRAVRCLSSSPRSLSSLYFPREARLDVVRASVGAVSSLASGSEVTGGSTTQFHIFPRDFPPSPASELVPAPTPPPSIPPTLPLSSLEPPPL